ncbi:anthrone oxygenase family protein [Microlunatus sp. GCM10028923]|uniref:anthrone oxygenase family protein n=1 Tax=Microlunatus sp. GCM10028923 TaxID=3273400 RepID=UPI00361D7424
MTSPYSAPHFPPATGPVSRMTAADRLRAAVLLAATLAMGLVAAVYLHWSETIMPALAGTDDRTFVIVEQRLDSAIFGPFFMGFGIAGSLLLTGIAWAALAGTRRRHLWPWLITALVLDLVGIMITMAANEPLNQAIRYAGDPHQLADPGAVRAAFQEQTWTVLNHVRAVGTVLATGCLGWALVLFGRSTAPAQPR